MITFSSDEEEEEDEEGEWNKPMACLGFLFHFCCSSVFFLLLSRRFYRNKVYLFLKKKKSPILLLSLSSDAVMAESETPKVTTPIARTSRRARLRNWSFFYCFVFFCVSLLPFKNILSELLLLFYVF